MRFREIAPQSAVGLFLGMFFFEDFLVPKSCKQI